MEDLFAEKSRTKHYTNLIVKEERKKNAHKCYKRSKASIYKEG